MDIVESIFKASWFPVLTGLGGYVGGFISDLGKEHFMRKTRLRDEHAQEIQKEILAPIYEYLREFYFPICQMKMSPLEIGRESIYRTSDHITQDTYLRTEFRVSIKTPAKTGKLGLFQDEYWHETEGFRRYFDDALKIHYPEPLKKWQVFSENYKTIVSQVKDQAVSLIPRLQEVAGLPSALAGGPEPSAIWANYPHLALVALHRQLGIDEGGLYFSGGSNNEVKTSRTQTAVLKCQSAEQAERIVSAIDRLIKDLAGTIEEETRFVKLEADVKQLLEDFRFALAKKPTPKKCPFV
ncbi:MAG: hypothetical protein HY547_00770 [Elusimicrobia bacterium]|nr:hypothetical protein [Elusimicrobiota bacterium]